MAKVLGQDIYVPNDVIRQKEGWVKYSLWEEDGSDLPPGARGTARPDNFAVALSLARKMERQDPAGTVATLTYEDYLIQVTRQRGAIKVVRSSKAIKLNDEFRTISAGHILRFPESGGVVYERPGKRAVDIGWTTQRVSLTGEGFDFCPVGVSEAYFTARVGGSTKAKIYWFRARVESGEDEIHMAEASFPATFPGYLTLQYFLDTPTNWDNTALVRISYGSPTGVFSMYAVRLHDGVAAVATATSLTDLHRYLSPGAALGVGYALTRAGEETSQADASGFAPAHAVHYVDHSIMEVRYINTAFTGYTSAGMMDAPVVLGRGRVFAVVPHKFAPSDVVRADVVAIAADSTLVVTDSSDVDPSGTWGGVRAGALRAVTLGDGAGLVIYRRIRYGGDITEVVEFDNGRVRRPSAGGVHPDLLASVCHEPGGAVLVVGTTYSLAAAPTVYSYRGGAFRLRLSLPPDTASCLATYAGSGVGVMTAIFPPEQDRTLVCAVSGTHQGVLMMTGASGAAALSFRYVIPFGMGWVYVSAHQYSPTRYSTVLFMWLDEGGLHSESLGTVTGEFYTNRAALCAKNKVVMFADDGSYVLTPRTPTEGNPSRVSKTEISVPLPPSGWIKVIHEDLIVTSTGLTIDLRGGQYVRAGI